MAGEGLDLFGFFCDEHELRSLFEHLFSQAQKEIDPALIFRSNSQVIGISCVNWPYFFYCSHDSNGFYIKFKHLPSKIPFLYERREEYFDLMHSCANFYYGGDVKPIGTKAAPATKRKRRENFQHKKKERKKSEDFDPVDFSWLSPHGSYQCLRKTPRAISALDYFVYKEPFLPLYLGYEDVYFKRDMHEYFNVSESQFFPLALELQAEVEDYYFYLASCSIRNPVSINWFSDLLFPLAGDKIYFISTDNCLCWGECASVEFPYFEILYRGRLFRRSVFSLGKSLFLTKQGAEQHLTSSNI